MLLEATTLAATASAMAQAIESYGCDSGELFAKAGLDKARLEIAGARYPMRSMNRLWTLAREATGDPCFGLTVGRYVRPTTLHALGFAWLASPTLGDGIRRLVRYCRVLNTAMVVQMEEDRAAYALRPHPGPSALVLTEEAKDCFCSAVVRMCRSMSNDHFAPRLVTFERSDSTHVAEYVKFFNAPVQCAAPRDAIYFRQEDMDAPLAAANAELAFENDRIAERYLGTLDPTLLGVKVREILIGLLPSGDANEVAIAKNLHKSVSSLQRGLRAEGVTYKQILDETRRALAEQYVRERRYALSEVAFLLGFSDQANFSRAFKRWTGCRPTDFAR